jgi:quercetin dioxygenase-like cupin family protein
LRGAPAAIRRGWLAGTPWHGAGPARRREDAIVKSVRAMGVLVLGLAAAGVAVAQAQVKRQVLQRADVPAGVATECVVGKADFEPGQAIGKHFHHGFEVGYVAEGELELLVDGEEPRRLKAGDSYRVEALRPHDARNAGSGPARVVATWVVEKGKPLAEPVK